MLMAVIVTLVFLPILGIIGDCMSSTISIPIAFLGRSICGLSFFWVTVPDSYLAYTLSSALVIFTGFETVCVEVYFMKGMPNEIRGTMAGLYAFFGELGCLFYTIVGGNMFDTVSITAPFTLLAITDSVVLLIFLVLIIFGKLR